MAETSKPSTVKRRNEEQWFLRFAPPDLPSIDIGCSTDPLYPETNSFWRQYDLIHGDGDATYMADCEDDSYYTVYASHILEHLAKPDVAVKNWWRILRPGGHLIICVPHRDLYEKKLDLPSRYNGDHKFYYLPDSFESPSTLSLLHVVLGSIEKYELMHLKVLDEGFFSPSPEVHSSGEYSIEIIVRKKR